MAELYPVAGCRIWIGGILPDKKDDFVAADFASQVWTEIDGWETMGGFGDAVALITTPLINRGRDKKTKGTANAPSMQNNFASLPDDPGQIKLITAGEASNKNNYAFRIDLNDFAEVLSATVTMTIASPGVITWTGHTLTNGRRVKFSTTGALPTGITEGTTYYVVNSAANTFQVSATPGGTAIATTGTQSGVHTVETVSEPSKRLFIGLVMGTQEQGGGANTSRLLSSTIEPNSNFVRIAPVA